MKQINQKNEFALGCLWVPWFFPQSKNMHSQSIRDTKLSVGVLVLCTRCWMFK